MRRHPILARALDIISKATVYYDVLLHRIFCAEFSCVEEKQKACSTYLRTFGVPCIDRLVYPEDAAVKTTLIATNLPFVLTADGMDESE